MLLIWVLCLTVYLLTHGKVNNENTNIDLGDCEQSLRQTYNLSDNETLFIKMLEVSQEEMRIPKVEYAFILIIAPVSLK